MKKLSLIISRIAYRKNKNTSQHPIARTHAALREIKCDEISHMCEMAQNRPENRLPTMWQPIPSVPKYALCMSIVFKWIALICYDSHVAFDECFDDEHIFKPICHREQSSVHKMQHKNRVRVIRTCMTLHRSQADTPLQ